MWLIGLYPLNFFLSNVFYYIWALLIVLCKINSCLTHCCSLFKLLNQNLNLKFYQMDFWFEFFDNHMNEKEIICHDYHGFKWKNINICPILIIFLWSLMPFFGSSDYDCTLLSLNILFLASYNLSILFLLVWFKQFILLDPMAIDMLPCSLRDSNVNLKLKHWKSKELGARSLACNILGVEGCARALRWD
jgi:hypothetical protein